MFPWRNSWLQLSIFTALFSAGVLGWDFTSRSSRAAAPAYSNPPVPAYTENNSTPNRSAENPPAPANTSSPQDTAEWHNSLGMYFVPAGTSGTLFSAWDTRVQDFQQFVQATGYDATADVLSLDQNGWRPAGHSWSNPGFSQTSTDPVVAVSWYDAEKFCAWLTQKERQAGVIAPNQYYRLPTDREWSTAAGNSIYPWGDNWPPAETGGNYLRQGDSALFGRSQLTGTDGYAFTSPVASFPSNSFGIFDLGGNVWQWTEDWYRREMTSEQTRRTVRSLDDDGGGQKYKAARGASFYDCFQLALLTGSHDRPLPTLRQTNFGFRCVLVVAP